MPPYGDFHRFEHLFLRRLFFLSVLYHFLRVVADLRIIRLLFYLILLHLNISHQTISLTIQGVFMYLKS